MGICTYTYIYVCVYQQFIVQSAEREFGRSFSYQRVIIFRDCWENNNETVKLN